MATETWLNSCTFRKNTNPHSLLFAYFPLTNNLGICRFRVFTINTYCAAPFECPAKNRYTKKFAFSHKGQIREKYQHGQRFPAGLVFTAHNSGFARNIFPTGNFVFQTDNVLQHPEKRFSPHSGCPCNPFWYQHGNNYYHQPD